MRPRIVLAGLACFLLGQGLPARAAPPPPPLLLSQQFPRMTKTLYLRSGAEVIPLNAGAAGDWQGKDSQGKWWRWYNGGLVCGNGGGNADGPLSGHDLTAVSVSNAGGVTVVTVRRWQYRSPEVDDGWRATVSDR